MNPGFESRTSVKMLMAAADVQALIKAHFFFLPRHKCELFHSVLPLSSPEECLKTLVLFHTA